ncbi:hypothetical protein AB4Z35_10565 [Pseudomonas sp. KB_15]|uniref:hypothetical protein n=1 Tax=Pseudomonas sp. KB_15 TaxID=3233035 RepID=UPI003F962A99
MSIPESDWKKFKELHKLALDRFCQGVLADAETIAQHSALSAQARYGMLYRLMRDRDKDIVRIFDPYSRSSAFSSLSMMVKFDLLTDAELSVLSEGIREVIADIVRQPYELEWAYEIVRQN